MKHNCPFCNLDAERIIYLDDYCIYFRDVFPISPGHTLIVPRRHIASLFDVNETERNALFSALDIAKREIDQEFQPDNYNIGINDGPAAGQTVPHLHIHLIPRYKGDCDDPRGGVRWIIPDKAKYWDES